MPTRPFWNLYGSSCVKSPKPRDGGGLKLLIGVYDQRRRVDVHAPNGVTQEEISSAAFVSQMCSSKRCVHR
jgi:hypothetical protein